MGGHFLTSVLDSIVWKEESFTNKKISHLDSHVDPIEEMKSEILEMCFLGKKTLTKYLQTLLFHCILKKTEVIS